MPIGSDQSFPVVLAAGAVLIVGLLSAAALAIEEEEYYSSIVHAEAAAQAILGALRKKHPRSEGGDHPRTRRYICWDRKRAKRCIEQDYLGVKPSFGIDDFKRIFRISRANYDNLRNYLSSTQPFFSDGYDVTNRERISTDAKILMSLKYLAYGCSVNAFRDYFQLGESTAMLCVKKFIKVVSNSMFRERYFSFFTPTDAKRVEALHHEKHGIRGMLGSLDCSHFVWGNCPVAHHGQYQGKEGKPTIVVEALADYNLYAWHAVFGYAGTLNDISIWDRSYLLQSLCDGSFSELDFPFTIGGESFDQLWMMVDGIYPPLARFVKPLTVPIGECEALFSMWQESKRKDIERFFGVFKKKSHFFSKPIPFLYMEDIIDAFYCSIILHNMAVTERIDSLDGCVESHTMYDCVNNNNTTEEPYRGQVDHLALQYVENQENDVHERAFEVQYLDALMN